MEKQATFNELLINEVGKSNSSSIFTNLQVKAHPQLYDQQHRWAGAFFSLNFNIVLLFRVCTDNLERNVIWVSA
jgi:hypothetical protein